MTITLQVFVATHVAIARDRARAILFEMQTQRPPDPQLDVAATVSRRLEALAAELLTNDGPSRPLDLVAADLTQLARLCQGSLARLKPILDHSVGIARREP